MNGIVNFYKPPGMTSFQAVQFLKKSSGQKAGHAGTLDPEAAGVLPIMLGRATKICNYLMNQEKQYLAEVRFGSATDTQDAQGKVLASSLELPNLEQVAAALPAFVGDIHQIPPQYSALKIGGETAYQMARQGRHAPLQGRPVHIKSIDLLKQTSEDSFLFRVICGKGVYIRTLCHDLGIALHSPAHLRFLLRERTGSFHLSDAVTSEELIDWRDKAAEQTPWLISMDKALSHLPRIELDDSLAQKALHGVALPVAALERDIDVIKQTEVCLFYRGELIGIFRLDGEYLRVAVMIFLVNQLG